MTKPNATKGNVRLTNGVVDAVRRLPAEQRKRRYWDAEFPPLYVQLSKKGAASYYFRYTKLDGGDGDYFIGPAEVVGAVAAREAARTKMSALHLHGIDPNEAKREMRQLARTVEERTFAAMAEAYIESKAKSRVGKRPLLETMFLRKYVVPILGKTNLVDVTEQQIVDMLHDVQSGVEARARRKNANGRSTANACHKAIKRVFRWAIRSKKAEKNPAAFERQFKQRTKKRKGRLTEERFAIFWSALLAKYNGSNRSFISLAIMIYMVTLQRPVDVARARRADFDLEKRTWMIPDDRTKTEEEYFIPLSDLAVALVREAFRRTDSEWLFPKAFGKEGHTGAPALTSGWCDIRDRHRTALGDSDIELYDCRRYGRTQIRHKLKFDKDVAEAVINHTEKGDIDTLYDVFEFEDLVREAQKAWGTEVMRMVNCTDLEALFPLEA